MAPLRIVGMARVQQGTIRTRRLRAAVLLAVLLSQTACSTLGAVKNTFLGGSSPSGTSGQIEGFIGAVVADEPRAALAGRNVLAQGGTAADAAVAVGFMLAVTLPSRAGLGGGGACLSYDPRSAGPGRGAPEAVMFTPVPGTGSGGDRPAAVPMLARGLFALHARYGSKPFEGLLTPAEQLARFGGAPSRALLQDLAVVQGPLLADPNARAVFAPNGVVLTASGTLMQADLGGTIAQLRTAGVGDFYQGALARRFEEASRLAGANLVAADFRAALPRIGAPLVVRAGSDDVAFTPPPADGGLGAAAALQVLEKQPTDTAGAQARAMNVVAAWRAKGGDPLAVLAQSANGAGPGTLPALPASTGFVVVDRTGRSVICSLTMNNLFGTGRIAPGTGVLLAASPAVMTPPMLAAGIVWNRNTKQFRAAATGTGQEGAPVALAMGLEAALRGASTFRSPPEPGRLNLMTCGRYLPGHENECVWAADQRGAGLAVGSN